MRLWNAERAARRERWPEVGVVSLRWDEDVPLRVLLARVWADRPRCRGPGAHRCPCSVPFRWPRWCWLCSCSVLRLWSCSAAWREAGLGFVLAAVAFVAVDRPATSRAWVLAAAPAVVLVAEAARVAVDARRRSGACHVEAAGRRGAAVAAAAGAAVAVLAALAVLILVPSGTVLGGLLPAALALAVAAVLAVAGGLHRPARRRARGTTPGPGPGRDGGRAGRCCRVRAWRAPRRAAPSSGGRSAGPRPPRCPPLPTAPPVETAATVAAAPADGISLGTPAG